MKEAWEIFNANNDHFSLKPKLIPFPYTCTLSVEPFPILTMVTPLSGRITILDFYKRVSSLFEKVFFLFSSDCSSYFP